MWQICDGCRAGIETCIEVWPLSKEAATVASDSRLGICCPSCCGVLQLARSTLAAQIIDAVVAAPFADCDRLALSISVPRVLSYTFAATILRVLESAATPLPACMGETVPDSILFFVRETACRMIEDEVHTHVLAAAAANASEGRRFHPKTFAAVDDPDTVVVDAPLDLYCSTSFSTPLNEAEDRLDNGPAFLSKPTNVKQLQEAAHSSQSHLAAAVAGLPQDLQANRGESRVLWSMIRDVILPAMQRDDSERRVLSPRLVPSVWRTPVFLYGRYRKLLRDVSQSPWFIKGDGGAMQRIGRASLQEIIATPAIKYFFDVSLEEEEIGESPLRRPPRAEVAPSTTCSKTRCAEVTASMVYGGSLYKFHSAGREDVDVRMLGAGRPFVLELFNAHRARLSGAQLETLASEIAASEEVEVDRLGVIVDRAVMPLLHQLSEEKRKVYRCVCYSSRAIRNDCDEYLVRVNALQNLRVAQLTPMRVVHRRSLLKRDKIVHRINVRRINEHWLLVDLETQAGAYIKEFCHGDLGRTAPSLGDLLHSVVDIVQLDVLGIDCAGAAAERLERLRVSF